MHLSKREAKRIISTVFLDYELALYLAQLNPDKSLCLSTISIALVLGMVLVGMDSKDKEKLLQRIGLESWEEAKVHKGLARIIEELKNTSR